MYVRVKDTKYNLRGTNMLSFPKVRSTKYGLRSFRYFAAKTWNALPDSIRAMAGTREFFKKNSSCSILKLLLSWLAFEIVNFNLYSHMY